MSQYFRILDPAKSNHEKLQQYTKVDCSTAYWISFLGNRYMDLG